MNDMKKISTLFKKDPNDLGRVIDEVDPENAWALTEGVATRKFDGTACAIIDGELYKRYDVKPNKRKHEIAVGNLVSKKSGKPFKDGQLVNEVTEITVNDHHPNKCKAARLKESDTVVSIDMLQVVGGWNNSDFKAVPDGAIPCQEPDAITGHWPHWVKCDRAKPEDKYHFEAFDVSGVWANGTYELCGPKINGNNECLSVHRLIRHGGAFYGFDYFERSFFGIGLFLKKTDVEGVVFHHPDGRMCKIRKSDFGIIR